MSESLGSAVLTLTTDDRALDEGLRRGEARAQKTADNFAAVGGKMRGVGAVLSVALTAPLIAFASESVGAAKESAEAMGQVESALKSMGGAAGRTRDQLADLAARQMSHSLYDDDEILRKVTANLLTFGNVAGDAFDRGQQAAIDMAARLGGDLQGATMMVGKALNDPIAGITALTRTGVQFTDQQKEQIKTMTEAGNRAGAQKLILGELERQFGGAAQAMRDADPAAALKQSFAAFQEDVGGRILPLLPPLLDGLSGIVDAFGSLDPSVQSFVMGAAGISVIAGPLLGFVGTLVSGVGTLIPLVTSAAGGLAAAGGAGGVAAAGLAPLAPILLPLAAAVGAVWLAWKNWDKIAPILQGVAQQAQTQTATIDGYLKSLTDEVNAFDQRMGIPSKDEAIASIARAVVSAWNTVNQYDLARWAAGVDAEIARSFSSAVAWAQRLYQGIRQWLVTNMQSVFAWVDARIQAVGDKFKWLWDVVVGHSYIPDLVDDIGREMKRLDAEMVQPTNRAADAAARAFQELQQRVRPMLDRLFPDQAKFAQFKKDMDDLAAYAKKVGLSDNVLEEAQRRRSSEYRDIDLGRSRDEIDKEMERYGDPRNVKIETTAIPGLPDLGMPEDDKADWREGFRSTFRDGLRAAMDGDLSGFFSRWLQDGAERGLDMAIDFLGQLLEGILGGGLSGEGGGFLALVGRAASSAFAGGFATGGLIPAGKFGIVGERGPEPIISTPKGALIRPNSTLSSMTTKAAGPSIYMPISIDATGADPAAIARVNSKLDQMRQDMPSTILRTVQDASDRRILSLGS